MDTIPITERMVLAMQLTRNIAKLNQNERMQAIIEHLEALRIAYCLQEFEDGTNIIVSMNPSDKTLVIGAHWDSVEGSTGANDNAAACSVLLKLIESLRNSEKSIDFVFFDKEENGHLGCMAYIDEKKDCLDAMINLDACGFGDTISLADKGNIGNRRFCNVMLEDTLNRHGVRTFFVLPDGDDVLFDQNKIDNISICTLSANDVLFFENLGTKLRMGEVPTPEDMDTTKLEVVTTIHNGPDDTIDSVNQAAIDNLYKFLLDGLS